MDHIDISNLFLSNLSRKDIEKHFANDARLQKILNIFDKVNSLDGKNDETLSSIDFHEMRGLKYGEKWGNGDPRQAFLDNSNDGKITDYELEKYYAKAQLFFGEDIEINDFKKFLNFSATKGNDNYNKELEKASQESGMSKELIEKLGGPKHSKEYKAEIIDGKQVFLRTVEELNYTEILDDKGNLLETREKHSSNLDYEDWEQITKYKEDGSSSETYRNHETGDMTRFDYGKTAEDKNYKTEIKNGIAIKQSHQGSDDPYWKNMQLEDIVFDAGTPDSTQVSFKYDKNNKLVGLEIKDNLPPEDELPRGFTTDGVTYFTHIPKKTTIDKSVMQSLQKMINGGARYGEDFDLTIEDGKLKIKPKVVNNTDKDTPDLKGQALKRYQNLIANGVHNSEDFSVVYNEDGSFDYILKNNQARDFSSTFKTEKYDKNGNLLASISVANNEVITETVENGQKNVLKQSLDDVVLELALGGKFDDLNQILGENGILEGGYDIYALADKYKETTGRDFASDVFDSAANGTTSGGLKNKLVPHILGSFNEKNSFLAEYQEGYEQFKEIRSFDPSESQIRNKLPKIGEKVQLSENHFQQKINNNTYDIKTQDGKFIITKDDGIERSLNISDFPSNFVKNTLSKIEANVLYDMAIFGVDFKLNENINSDAPIGNLTNGRYVYDHKEKVAKIELDPNATIGERMIRTITHEAGHMCDMIDDKNNAINALKERMKDPWVGFGRDKPLTLNEMLEKSGTVQPSSLGDKDFLDCFNQEYELLIKNPPNVNDNSYYCTSSIEEFFAEAYALYTTGDCKSEYILANYFPKTFAMFIEKLEANRARYENTQKPEV